MIQTFYEMPEIHSTRPSTLIHFEHRQRPFDFQRVPAERRSEAGRQCGRLYVCRKTSRFLVFATVQVVVTGKKSFDIHLCIFTFVCSVL